MIKQINRLWTAVTRVVFLAVLSAGLLTSCVEPLDEGDRPIVDPNARELTIRIYVPGATPATKAGTGDVAGVSPESQIYGVQVWMFNHHADATGDDETAVSYAEVTNLNWAPSSNLPGSDYYTTDSGRWTDGSIYELPLRIPGYVLDRPDAQMRFDFYVLANGASIGSPAARTMRRSELKALTFGKTATTDDYDYFGTTAGSVGSVKTGTTPPIALGTNGPGLPISGFFNKSTSDTDGASGVDLSFLKPETFKKLSLDQIRAKTPVVQLERAVSKIRFAFVRPKGLTNVQITKIEINEKLIPSKTYVFPRETGDFLGTGTNDYPEDYYDNSPAATIQGANGAPLLNTNAIKEMTDAYPDPKVLRSTSTTVFSAEGKSYDGKAPTGDSEATTMTAQMYSDLLDDFTSSQLVYLRESGKPITGTITYSLDGGRTTQTASFYMPSDAAGAANTNFHRNHSWIVYAYFQGEGLYIRPVVLDWVDVASYSYKQHGSAVLAMSDGKESIFGYGWTTSTENTWYTANKPTEWYFRHQDEDYLDAWTYDWVHSQMVSAYGSNAGGVPIYANRIELRTTGFNVSLRLKLSNPDDFYIVTYNNYSAKYIKWIYGDDSLPTNLPSGWTEADGAVIPQSIAVSGTTYFYVVPKAATAAGSTTGAYLITDPSSTSSERLPFNASVFPGSQTNTEIYFYSVSADTFKEYYTSRPDSIKAYTYDDNATPNKAYEVTL